MDSSFTLWDPTPTDLALWKDGSRSLGVFFKADFYTARGSACIWTVFEWLTLLYDKFDLARRLLSRESSSFLSGDIPVTLLILKLTCRFLVSYSLMSNASMGTTLLKPLDLLLAIGVLYRSIELSDDIYLPLFYDLLVRDFSLYEPMYDLILDIPVNKRPFTLCTKELVLS